MFIIKYLITNKYVFILIVFNNNNFLKKKEKNFIIFQSYIFKTYYNWLDLSFFLKEFLYDGGLLKWKKNERIKIS